MTEYENKPNHELLKHLTKLDFMATDLALYLDTHPHDKEAIDAYNSVISEAESVRCEYEKQCGPLLSFRCKSDNNKWSWIDDPWPWQKQFNYKETPEQEGYYVGL